MASTSRSLHQPWSTPWATPPPSSCSTLILASSTVSYGATCVFPEDDADASTIDPFNTACLPWLAGSATPASNAFYSPVTACPPSWSAVATQTSGLAQAVDGETALSCCPNGFEDGGGGVCKPASTGSFAVVECGEADAEENESRTYAGASWPASATISIPALQLRFRAEDLGDASTTGTATSSSTPSGSNTSGGDAGGGGGGGLSPGVKAAIGTVIPLAIIMFALAAFLLWRRRRHNKAVALNEKAFAEPGTYSDTKPMAVGVTAGSSQHSNAGGAAAGTSHQPYAVGAAAGTSHDRHAVGTAAGTSHRLSAEETPEWNTELEATEAQHQRAVAPAATAAHASAAHPSASELGGLARKPRKPVPAVEMEGSAVPVEMDVSRYMAYQPSRNEASQP
jgi:hypothetical protein